MLVECKDVFLKNILNARTRSDKLGKAQCGALLRYCLTDNNSTGGKENEDNKQARKKAENA